MTEVERDQILTAIDAELTKGPALVTAIRDRDAFLRNARKAIENYYGSIDFTSFVSTQSTVYGQKLGAIESAADAMGTDAFTNEK